MSYLFTKADTDWLWRAEPYAAFPFTVAFKFKPNDVGATQRLGGGGTSGYPGHMVAEITDEGATFATQGSVQGASASDTGPVGATGDAFGAWHSVVFGTATSGDSRRIVVDGGSAVEDASPDVGTTAHVLYTIGTRYANSVKSGLHFDGYLAEVAFWQVLLSEAEMQAYCADGALASDIQTANLVSWLRFIEDTLVDEVDAVTWTVGAGSPVWDADHPAGYGGGGGIAPLALYHQRHHNRAA